MTTQTISQESLQDFAAHWEEYLLRALEPLTDTDIAGFAQQGSDCPIACALKDHFGIDPHCHIFIGVAEFSAAGLAVKPPISAVCFIEAIDEAGERTPLTKAQALHTLALSLHAAGTDPDDLPFD